MLFLLLRIDHPTFNILVSIESILSPLFYLQTRSATSLWLLMKSQRIWPARSLARMAYTNLEIFLAKSTAGSRMSSLVIVERIHTNVSCVDVEFSALLLRLS